MEVEFGDAEFRLLLSHFNRSWQGYRKVRKGVMRRIRGHMRELQVSNVQDYLIALEDEREMEKCNVSLLVTISRFFRDKHLWEILQSEILPDLQNHFDESVRCWSAGCASGEEPYSLAIVVELLGGQTTFEIIATDKNKSCLARAQKGIFPRSSLREVCDDNRKKFFTQRYEGEEYLIHPILKSKISFFHRELMGEPPPGFFHLIMLRNNLLTYQQGRDRDFAFEKIMGKLLKNGILVIGSHEKIPPHIGCLEQNSQCKFLFKRI